MKRNGWAWFLAGWLLVGMRVAAAQSALPRPAIRAAAAIVVEAKTGAVLFAKNPDKRLPPASTTKILTALLLARRVPPKQSILTSPMAAQTPGSALGMKPGEKFPARDLLHAILLQSANDASAAAAEHAGGTVEKFVAQMNAEAQAMGAKNTHFVNPHGLHDPQHLSTARDLATMARQAIRNPAFNAAARTKTYAVPRSGGQPPTLLKNKNDLLWTFPGADGIKTGWTRAAGYCLVGSATQRGRRLITVVLNSPDWQGETAALLRYGFSLPPSNRLLASQSGPASPQSASGDAPSRAGQAHAPQPPYTGARGGKVGMEGGGQPTDPALKRRSGPRNLPSQVASEPAQAGFAGQEGVSTPSDTADTADTASAPKPDRRGRQPEAGRESMGMGEPLHGDKPDASGNSGMGRQIPPDEDVEAPATPRPPPNPRIRGQGGAGKSPSTAQQEPSRFPSHEATPRHFSWWWLWLLFLLLLLLIVWRRRRAGTQAMNVPTLNPFSKRRQTALPPSAAPTRHETPAPPLNAQEQEPPFVFAAPRLARHAGTNWLDSVLESPRLLEPAARRQARALLDANPRATIEKALKLLADSSAKVRVAAAGLLLPHAPRRAEETLLEVLDDAHAPADVHAEAIQLLAAHGGDRYEERWLQETLHAGSTPAAHALASQLRLDKTTRETLHRLLPEEPSAPQEGTPASRTEVIGAHAACILGAQGHIAPDVASSHLERLPRQQRDQIVVGVLRGADAPWAVEQLVETVLHGHAYPALQALLECDPALVRAAVSARENNIEGPARIRATVLKWLILGEGEEEPIHRLAEAGDDLASGALQLHKLYRWNPEKASADALLAAAQIFSLRLGYSDHSQEQVATAFRAAATGESPSLSTTQTSELKSLAQAYTHPQVHDAVQMAMHAEDGLDSILAALARHPENQSYQEELAFWSDKVPEPTRLLVTQSLATSIQSFPVGKGQGVGQTAQEALAARATDPSPTIRAAALRALRSQTPAESATPPQDQAADTLSETPLKRAA